MVATAENPISKITSSMSAKGERKSDQETPLSAMADYSIT
jgi:hypothetical protein